MYRYDAETGVMTRISVGQGGYNDNGNNGSGDAEIPFAVSSYGVGTGPARADPTMSDNGEYVFFQSPIALAPGALQDAPAGEQGRLAENIYSDHHGTITLITNGTDTTERTGAGAQLQTPVELLGSDKTGANVFFATNEPMTGRNGPQERNFFDWHQCSETFYQEHDLTPQPCFPPESSPPAPCAGEACQGPPASPTCLVSPAAPPPSPAQETSPPRP